MARWYSNSMLYEPSEVKKPGAYICPRCNSKVLSVLNHPVKQNMVIETANCPQCKLVWRDQWILPGYPTFIKYYLYHIT